MIKAKITKDGVTMEVEASSAREMTEVVSSYFNGNKVEKKTRMVVYTPGTSRGAYSDEDLKKVVEIALNQEPGVTTMGMVKKAKLSNPQRKVSSIASMISRIRSYYFKGKSGGFTKNAKQRIDMAIVTVTGKAQSGQVKVSVKSDHIWGEKISLLDE